MSTSADLPSGGILDLIRSKSFEGRKALIDDLRRERSERSVSLLLEVLNDQSWSLRELAVSALAETPDLAAEPLMALLDDGLWYTRAAAVRGLGLMGHGPALPRLLAMLEDDNTTIATEVARALLNLARKGRSVAVTRGILARGEDAGATLLRLERVDPDAGRKLRILANREEVAAPIVRHLADEGSDPEVLMTQLAGELDESHGVTWDDIAGPVGD
jgi:hypothetical protein